jgi:glucose-1-phosphate thymidylyltransferase
MERRQLHVEVMGRGFAWLDTGTHASLLQASQYVEILEQRQGLRLACPEEVAYRLGYISLDELAELAKRTGNSPYGAYLMSISQSFKDAGHVTC